MARGDSFYSPASQTPDRDTPPIPEAGESADLVADLLTEGTETPLSPAATTVPRTVTAGDSPTGIMPADTSTTVTKPKFGDVYPGDSGVVWIGGPPKEDWSGSTLANPTTPLCIRGLDPVSQQKSYAKRVLEGNSIKFKRDDDDYPLMAFADEALYHMQTHGMDTVFYMKGAQDGDEAVGEKLFTYHTKYTKGHVDKFVRDALRSSGNGPQYDSYYMEALKDSAA